MKRSRLPANNNPIVGTVQVLRIDPRLYLIDPETLPTRTPQERWFRELIENLHATAPRAPSPGWNGGGSTMKRIPGNGTFIGTTAAGERVYATRDAIVTRKPRKPPWHTTIVCLLAHLHGISPAEYEVYRNGERELREIFLDVRFPGYPTWTSLHGDRRYRYKPAERYFETADELIRAGRVM